MNQTFDEFYNAIAQGVTDGFVGYFQLFSDAIEWMNACAAEKPNMTLNDGKDFPHQEFHERVDEVLEQLAVVLWQLETLIAQYTGQSSEKLNDEQKADEQTKIDEAKSKFLYAQLKSGYYSAWLEVAESDIATSRHLKEAAKLCAKISNNDTYRKSIAEAIARHPAADDESLLPLCESAYFAVWLIAAKSTHAGKKTLTRLAVRCAEIDTSDTYRESISVALANHHLADDNTLYPLSESRYYSVWLVAAKSPRAGRRTLLNLADKCSMIENNDNRAEEIAQGIASHANATDEILAALSDSKYFTVWEIAAKSQYAGKMTLSRLADKCAKPPLESKYLLRAAEAIAYNPNCTIEILSRMAGACQEKVGQIASKRMRDM